MMRPNTERRLRRAVALRAGISPPSADDPEGWTITDTGCVYCGAFVLIAWNGGYPTFTHVRRLDDGSYLHEPAHLDHVIPESRNGPTSLDNTVIACRTCNLAKGDAAFGDQGFIEWLHRRRLEVAAFLPLVPA
jgi:5-methylcytosine-specific restriction endonuclease McrA